MDRTFSFKPHLRSVSAIGDAVAVLKDCATVTLYHGDHGETFSTDGIPWDVLHDFVTDLGCFVENATISDDGETMRMFAELAESVPETALMKFACRLLRYYSLVGREFALDRPAPERFQAMKKMVGEFEFFKGGF